MTFNDGKTAVNGPFSTGLWLFATFLPFLPQSDINDDYDRNWQIRRQRSYGQFWQNRSFRHFSSLLVTFWNNLLTRDEVPGRLICSFCPFLSVLTHSSLSVSSSPFFTVRRPGTAFLSLTVLSLLTKSDVSAHSWRNCSTPLTRA